MKVVEEIFTKQTNSKYDMRNLLGIIRKLEERVELAEKCMAASHGIPINDRKAEIVKEQLLPYKNKYPEVFKKLGF